MDITRDSDNHSTPPPSARGEVSGVFRIPQLGTASPATASDDEGRPLAERVFPQAAPPSRPPTKMKRLLAAMRRWVSELTSIPWPRHFQ